MSVLYSFINLPSHVPHNDISVNSGPHTLGPLDFNGADKLSPSEVAVT